MSRLWCALIGHRLVERLQATTHGRRTTLVYRCGRCNRPVAVSWLEPS